MPIKKGYGILNVHNKILKLIKICAIEHLYMLKLIWVPLSFCIVFIYVTSKVRLGLGLFATIFYNFARIFEICGFSIWFYIKIWALLISF